MKKFLILLLFIFSFNVLSVSAESFFAPEWSEFCPARYVYLHPEKRYFLQDKKYWQQRKISFDRKVNYCSSLSENKKTNCFSELRKMEKNATDVQMKQDENDNIKTLKQYGRY